MTDYLHHLINGGNMKAKQPDMQEPLTLSLTPSEIGRGFMAEAHKSMVSYASYIQPETVIEEIAAENERTGHCARFAYLTEHREQKSVAMFVAEVQIANVCVIGLWECDAANHTAMEYCRTQAEDCFIALAALIGKCARRTLSIEG